MEASASMTVLSNATRGVFNLAPLIKALLYETKVWCVHVEQRKVYEGRILEMRRFGKRDVEVNCASGEADSYTKCRYSLRHVFSSRVDAHNALCEILQHEADRYDRLIEDIKMARDEREEKAAFDGLDPKQGV